MKLHYLIAITTIISAHLLKAESTTDYEKLMNKSFFQALNIPQNADNNTIKKAIAQAKESYLAPLEHLLFDTKKYENKLLILAEIIKMKKYFALAEYILLNKSEKQGYLQLVAFNEKLKSLPQMHAGLFKKVAYQPLFKDITENKLFLDDWELVENDDFTLIDKKNK